jgi:tetratricopeptide (TPR) repeat protein
MQPVNYDAALQHYQAGRFAEASAICGVILNQTPRDFPTLRLLGSVRGQQGAFDEAVYFLTAALGIGSPDTEAVIAALNELAAVELAQQHHDAALDSYRRALAIRPDDAGTMYNYGNAFYAANRIDDALEIYGRGLALHPDYAEMHNNFGNALRSAKRLEEAADSYGARSRSRRTSWRRTTISARRCACSNAPKRRSRVIARRWRSNRTMRIR